MRNRNWPRTALALGVSLLAACHAGPGGRQALVGEAQHATQGISTLVRGKGIFPLSAISALRVVSASGARSTRRTAASPEDLTSFATVTLFAPDTGRAIATGLTDAQGAFSLVPGGTFSPALDACYYLQVTKRVGAATTGTNQLSLLTVLKWTAAGWTSITNAAGGAGDIVLNPTTTAVALIDREDAATALADVIGKVSGAPTYDQVTPFTTHTDVEVGDMAATITYDLSQDVDPVGDRPGYLEVMAPDDYGDATEHHDYQVTKNGVTSTFVWIPLFTAYQLVNPAASGHAAKPAGAWVKDRPIVGTEDVHWARETFGGFYAGKYEASRADATDQDEGESTTLKVQSNRVAWTEVAWYEAAAACLDYDVRCHLMRDDEWTALAVWATINGVTVHGNNDALKDADDGQVTFTLDPTHDGLSRALTGTGTKAGWTGITNLTTHTGTTAGVYDLNGNLEEWTATITSDATFRVNVIDTGITPPSDGYVSTLNTDSRLRRFGLPNTTDDSNSTLALGKDWSNFASGSRKMSRGGAFTDWEGAGLWATNLFSDTGDSDAKRGFRPVLSFR